MVIQPMVRSIGAALIVLGIIAFTYRGVPYSSHEQVIDAVSLQASVNSRKTISMPPLLIGLVFAAGGALLALGSPKAS